MIHRSHGAILPLPLAEDKDNGDSPELQTLPLQTVADNAGQAKCSRALPGNCGCRRVEDRDCLRQEQLFASLDLNAWLYLTMEGETMPVF